MVCVLMFFLVPQAASAGKGLPGVTALSDSYGKTPLYFIPNYGQLDPQVRFYAAARDFNIWLTNRGMVFDSGDISDRDVSRLEFVGASASPSIEALDPTQHRVNFLRGSDKRKWHRGIPTSRAVLYKNIYRGIQLKVYGKARHLEYDWIVEPGADPAAINWQYCETGGTYIDDHGDLNIKTVTGRLVHKRPVSFQLIDGRKVSVTVTFKKSGSDIYGFSVGRYDRNHPLIIDPVVLSYSTYLGGSDFASGMDIAVDDNGCAYVTGYTRAVDFPVVNPVPDANGGGWLDGFVTKFSADGSQLIYSTYLGGSDSEIVRTIAVDSSGCAYVAGNTSSWDFPIKNAFQPANADQYSGGDAFVSKLSNDGSQLVYSSYLGGEDWDEAFGIAVDASGSACVAGYTYSHEFPLKNPLKEIPNDYYYSEGFITKFSPEGDQLVFSTYLGGDHSDSIADIAMDSSGGIYVTGNTGSFNFPTVNPLNELRGYGDSFVSKIAADGSELIYSTFLGGSDYEYATGISVDAGGSAYVTGGTSSKDFPVVNAFQDGDEYGYDQDCYISKFAPDGSHLIYSTYLGGSGWDTPESIAVDTDGSAVLVGHTNSLNFPLAHAIKETPGYYDDDTFVTKFTPEGNSLVFSTLVGGSSYDKGMAVVLDTFGNVYMTGYTSSDNFPVVNAFMAENPSLHNDSAFVTKILNFLIYIDVQRHTEQGWLIRKEFGRITLVIDNVGNIPIDRYIVYRKSANGTFQSIGEISSQNAQKNYVFIDWQIDRDQSYTYKVEALDADGNMLATTGEQSI